MDRYEHQATHGTRWLHVAAFILLLWAVSSETFAQVRDLVVTEVSGSVSGVGNGSAPLRVLETVRPATRLRLGPDSQLALFSAADAHLYVMSGPAEVSIGPREIVANGKPVAPRKLHDAYRTIKGSTADLVQGSLVMRNAAGLRVLSPEGVVGAGTARQFSWTPAPGAWRFELSADSGDVVYRSDVRGASLELPADLKLRAGSKYVWGLLPATGSSAPVDWTEFVVTEEASAPAKGEAPSERIVHAMWLRSRGLERAAIRTAAEAQR